MPMRTKGLALVCDAEGVVQRCLHDDLGIAKRTPDRPFVMLLDGSSYRKGLQFLAQVYAGGPAVDTELCFVVDDEPCALTVAAAAQDHSLVIVAAESTLQVKSLSETLASRDGEHADAYARIGAAFAGSPENPGGEVYEEYMRMYNDFARLQRDFARQNADLKRLATEKDLLLDAAAHDLRNPLNAISLLAMSVSEVASDRLTDQEKVSLERITDTARDMGDLINNLLKSRRKESGLTDIERVDTDILALCRVRIGLLSPQAQQKDLSIELQTSEAAITFPVDPTRLQQVVDNLLGNAVHYSPSNGTIELKVETRDGALHLAVCDRGPGIPEVQLFRVFEPFFRGASPARTDNGVGLGLAICRTIVSAHGGEIWATNRIGGGTIVSIRIPRANPEGSVLDRQRRDTEAGRLRADAVSAERTGMNDPQDRRH